MTFDRVIVTTMTPFWPLLDGDEKAAVVTEVVREVTRSLAGAPFHIRLAVKSLSIFLSLGVVLITAGAGGPLTRANRADKFYRFLQNLPGPLGSVLRLYRSMTLLAFYEQTPVATKLFSARRAQHSRRCT
ncbi:hypothetical protein [Ensifer sp. BR816]|uniref:hypothetical protein n=1 Tax=Rhizobium sp. (strain BR816) TaxID=1057002 RepID=UPI001FD9CD9C|nr:hypothetical protein [Ensifer sp. BR816]